MASRTPSFVVVGLVIIMFLLGFFYMSCSSKTTELRQTLDEFEERIRSLTLKNSDHKKTIDSINTRKHELEQEKVDVHRQMEKKDSEINDLNTKFNEKIAEIQSLKSDNKVLGEQLKESKNTSETLSQRNSDIEKLQQEYNEQKKTNDEQSIRFKQEIENYKNQLHNSSMNQEKALPIPNQRFQPLVAPNEATKNTSSLLQEPLAKLSNITNDIKEKVFNRLGIGNNSIFNRNGLPQQPDQGEHARVPPELGAAGDKDDQAANIPEVRQRLHRSLNDSILDRKPLEFSNGAESDNKQRFDRKKIRKAANFSSLDFLNEINNVNNNQPNIVPSRLLGEEKNYRIADRHQFLEHKNNDQREPLKRNGQEVFDHNNPEKQIPRGNLL